MYAEAGRFVGKAELYPRPFGADYMAEGLFAYAESYDAYSVVFDYVT